MEKSAEQLILAIMKKLKKLKLNALSEVSLEDKEMKALKGGTCCTCSCYWENRGGSDSNDNMKANYKTGAESTQGCNEFVYCDEPNEVVPLPSNY